MPEVFGIKSYFEKPFGIVGAPDFTKDTCFAKLIDLKIRLSHFIRTTLHSQVCGLSGRITAISYQFAGQSYLPHPMAQYLKTTEYIFLL
jgi:hypothetical protein